MSRADELFTWVSVHDEHISISVGECCGIASKRINVHLSDKISSDLSLHLTAPHLLNDRLNSKWSCHHKQLCQRNDRVSTSTIVSQLQQRLCLNFNNDCVSTSTIVSQLQRLRLNVTSTIVYRLQTNVWRTLFFNSQYSPGGKLVGEFVCLNGHCLAVAGDRDGCVDWFIW